MTKRRAVTTAVLSVLLAVSAAGPCAWATPPLQKKARAAGLPATDCTYCHAFSMDHMNRKALEMRIPPMNCYACHGNRLPREGKALFNARGQWLIAEKRARQAEDFDVAWLKAYVPAEAPPVKN